MYGYTCQIIRSTEGGSLVRRTWMTVGRAQKCKYNTFGFIVLKEVSALRFGGSQHKGQTALRAVCLTILTVPQWSGPHSLEEFKSFVN